MAEQGPKAGVRSEPRARARDASSLPRDDGFDTPEPTHSEARAVELSARERARDAPEGPSAWDADTKVERRSLRPSAFGAPRKSQPPAAETAQTTTLELPPERAHEPEREARRASDEEPRALTAFADPEPRVFPALAPSEPSEAPARLANQRARGAEPLIGRGTSQPPDAQLAARAEPISHAPKVEAVRRPGPAREARALRRPWLSLALFGGMISLSVVPLLRYTEGTEEPQQPARASAASGASALSVQPTPAADEAQGSTARVEPLAVGREQLIASLLSEGTRALEAGDTREGERLFGRVLELAEDNPRAAYGLARIRLSQNNLSGAEGWIQLALRKRPRRGAYHALYAEVLTRMGRITEAREEQMRASAQRDGDAP